jgi:hypothetical protein
VVCWFFQNQASLPQVRQVTGFPQVFPSDATRYAWGDGDDRDVGGAWDGSSSDRCSWEQALFGCFVLWLGALRVSMGFPSEGGTHQGRPQAPSGPFLGSGRLRPLHGAAGSLCFFPFLAWSWIPPGSDVISEKACFAGLVFLDHFTGRVQC